MQNVISFLFLFFIVTIACDNSQQIKNTPPSDTIVADASGESTISPDMGKQIRYTAIVDHLQIRDTFNTKGKVLGKMSFGQTAEYLGFSSPKKDKITLRGKEREAAWKKIRFADEQGKTIVGWIYAGGAVSNLDAYQPIEDKEDVYVRPINRFSAKELSDILGITLSHDYYYDGNIYYTKRAGKFLKNGTFSLRGNKFIEISDNYTHEMIVELKGSFVYDAPHGIFEQKWTAYEGMTTTTISFDNGKCLRADYFRMAEGDDLKYKEESPKSCASFPAIEERGEESAI